MVSLKDVLFRDYSPQLAVERMAWNRGGLDALLMLYETQGKACTFYGLDVLPVYQRCPQLVDVVYDFERGLFPVVEGKSRVPKVSRQ